MALDVVWVVLGLALLARGADRFVLSAARLSATLSVSPVVIGAVVVGFGTGLPELVVSTSAAARGSLDVAVGNVVGSNLANLTLVLGVAGLIAAPETVPRVLRREAPLSFAAVALFALVVQGGMTRTEGAVLLVAFAAAVTVLLLVTEPQAGVAVEGEPDAGVLIDEVEELVEEEGETSLRAVRAASTRRDVARAAVALAATVVGAQLLVVGARSIASTVGLSGGFVGLTIVALGTSLPELVTAAQSARRGETALLVGNVLGSNLFNSTAVAAVAAFAGPRTLDEPRLTVVAVSSMVLTAALAWLFLGLGGRLRRWEASVLLAVYAATLPFTR